MAQRAYPLATFTAMRYSWESNVSSTDAAFRFDFIYDQCNRKASLVSFQKK
jgi:hypothetical protein